MHNKINNTVESLIYFYRAHMPLAKSRLFEANILLLIFEKAEQLALITFETCGDVRHFILERLLGDIVDILSILSFFEHI